MPVFLTSNGFYDIDVFDRFIKCIEEYEVDKKICFITTAIADRDNRLFHVTKTEEQFRNAGFRTVDFIDFEYDDPNLLLNYPIVCIFGGNPFFLLDRIKKFKVDEVFRNLWNNGCLIAGHSAGAVVLGKTIRHAQILHPDWNEVGLMDFEAVGIIHEVILPHLNRYEGQESLLRKLEINGDYKLTKIEDGQWIIL